MTLSVVHLSTADTDGGSARSAYRIHDGLRHLGHASRMLVGYKYSDDPDVQTVSRGRLVQRSDEIASRLGQMVGLQYLLIPSTLRTLRHPWLARPDIIQLFNIHGGYFSYLQLSVLSRRAPIVWRLSDMWAMTGHCAYAGPCERWRTGCGVCPDLDTYPSLGIDTTAALWRLKRQIYRRCRLTVVAPSSWIETVARASPLFADCAVHRIPNGLDLEVFQPMERGAARKLLGLPQEPKALLFLSHVAAGNRRKGTDLLLQALQRLGPRPDLMVLVAGKNAEAWRGSLPSQVIPLGYIEDDQRIRAAYAASDILVVPSAVENLPNTIIEAMACGRPVIAFDVGGTRDAVRDQETGILVPAGDVGSLTAAMASLLDDEAARLRMGDTALRVARAEFSKGVQARRFESLYLTLIDGPTG